jgi:hypothetical protein
MKRCLEDEPTAVQTVIATMRRGLCCEKNDHSDDGLSRRVIEVQRLCTLVIGSGCDGSEVLKTRAVDEGFVLAATEALEWFCGHAVLTQWILWAMFITTFSHPANKVELMRRNGLMLIICAMQKHRGAVLVQRQAIALLFSCLMQSEGLDVRTLRQSAKNVGMSEAIAEAIRLHPTDKHLCSMGRNIIECS